MSLGLTATDWIASAAGAVLVGVVEVCGDDDVGCVDVRGVVLVGEVGVRVFVGDGLGVGGGLVRGRPVCGGAASSGFGAVVLPAPGNVPTKIVTGVLDACRAGS